MKILILFLLFSGVILNADCKDYKKVFRRCLYLINEKEADTDRLCDTCNNVLFKTNNLNCEFYCLRKNSWRINLKLNKSQLLIGYAKKYLGKFIFTSNKNYYQDCSGFIRYIFKKSLKIDLFNIPHKEHREKGRWINGVALIYKYVQKNGKIFKYLPKPGDIIFFDNTSDKNRDGKINDRLTHIALIIKVKKDGTIIFIHHSSEGVNISRMNFYNKKHNSLLRKYRKSDSKNTPHYTYQMFNSFGRLFQEEK